MNDADAPQPSLPSSESIGFLIRDCMMLLHKLLRTHIGPHDISTAQWFLLRVLWEEEGLSQRELSERVNTTEPTTQSALLRMERQGIIRRAKNPNDKRANRIYLTAKGRKLETKMIPYAQETVNVAAQGLTAEELATLKRLINKVRVNLKEATKDV
jgi:MarR family transcriptional regulator, organic hydroperoxide resistance regulator